MCGTCEVSSRADQKNKPTGKPVGLFPQMEAIYLGVVGVVVGPAGVDGVDALGVETVLLPPQPRATTEKARTAVRTRIFFIEKLQ